MIFFFFYTVDLCKMISRGRESEKEKTLPEVGHFSVCLPSALLWNNGILLDIEIDGERKKQ